MSNILKSYYGDATRIFFNKPNLALKLFETSSDKSIGVFDGSFFRVSC